MIKLYLLFSLIFFCGIEAKSFRILNESLSLADVDFRTYKIPNSAHNWNLTGRLVVTDPFDACDDIKNGDELTGNIALVDKYTCALTKKIERLKQLNVSAVIVFNQQNVAQFAFTDGLSDDDKVCEVFSVLQQDTDKLKKTAKDEVLIVQVKPMTSPWWELDKEGALVFFTLFFLLVQLTGIGLAVYKSVCFWSVKKYRWSVPTTSLALLICGFIVQIPIHLDPVSTRGLYSQRITSNIFTISFPFVMSVSILIAFYWQAAISAVYNARFLPSNKKLLIPVGVLCGLFLILELVRIVTGLQSPEAGSSTAGFVLFFLYLAIIELVSLFYIASASRVLLFLRTTKSTQKTMKARKLTAWLLVSAVSYFVMPFFFGLVFVPPSPEKASLFMTLFVADGLYHLVQFSLVMAFQAPSLASTRTTMDRTSSAEKPSSNSGRNEDMASIELA